MFYATERYIPPISEDLPRFGQFHPYALLDGVRDGLPALGMADSCVSRTFSKLDVLRFWSSCSAHCRTNARSYDFLRIVYRSIVVAHTHTHTLHWRKERFIVLWWCGRVYWPESLNLWPRHAKSTKVNLNKQMEVRWQCSRLQSDLTFHKSSTLIFTGHPSTHHTPFAWDCIADNAQHCHFPGLWPVHIHMSCDV